MRLNVIAITLSLMGSIITPTAIAATEASAIATWKATAKKDTTSDLVVTPLGSLSFQYAEGIKRFNTVDGLFDVTIIGHSGTTESPITNFSLRAKKLSGTLNHINGASTLEVGVLWQGTPLTNTGYVNLIETQTGNNGGTLSPLARSYRINNQRTSAQGGFAFTIESARTGTTNVTDFGTLPDGMWSGDVNVEFVANWI
ncbi:TPA: fimbrial protein [Aeromonas dhakensis]|uniref:common pilus major fimbrillin subunit EcpA n=1 Tax=Aeromonas dhakensis TaxID=196024 RepID=UPI00288E1900|nr:fimbrial protein [Aeromonas dhakensis]